MQYKQGLPAQSYIILGKTVLKKLNTFDMLQKKIQHLYMHLKCTWKCIKIELYSILKAKLSEKAKLIYSEIEKFRKKQINLRITRVYKFAYSKHNIDAI